MGGVPEGYFWLSTAGTAVFLAWLYWVSPKVKGKGRERNRALVVGAIFLAVLIIPDIWALTKLESISWFVAWTISLLFVHIIQAGIWHRIAWGERCPECNTWMDSFEEAVPDNPSAARRAHRCPHCGWTDSWIAPKKAHNGGGAD